MNFVKTKKPKLVLHEESDLSNNKQMIKTNKTQLSIDQRFLTNQTNSDSERENGYAKKSQETKVKTQMTRKALKS
jgi:hypothetical protein